MGNELARRPTRGRINHKAEKEERSGKNIPTRHKHNDIFRSSIKSHVRYENTTADLWSCIRTNYLSFTRVGDVERPDRVSP